MLALIDADILVYEAAYRSQEAFEWEPGEWTHHASLSDGQDHFRSSIEFIMAETKSDSAILALTDSDRDSNFRRSVWPAYKDHREGPGDGRPLLYKALRQWIRDEYNVKEKHGIEGDDTIGIMATGDIKGLPPVEERVICSIDKDLDTIPGRHFNWRKPDLMVYGVQEDLANWNFMFQTLTGDSVDGYPGLPGIGPKRAEKVLEGLLDAGLGAMWHAVVEAYEKKGMTEDDALVQARCARILQASDWDFDNETVRLWTPPEGDKDE